MTEIKKVVPIRRDEGSSPRASGVQPVARKVSATELLTPRGQLERVIMTVTRAGLDAYRDAARAQAAGDDHGAELLREAAALALSMAQDAAERLGELA